MAIHVDVLARLNQRQVAREADKLAAEFDEAGARANRAFTDAFSREAERNSAKVQKAFHAYEDASLAVEKTEARLRKLQATGKASEETLRFAAEDVEKALRKQADAHRAAAAAVEDYGKRAKKAADDELIAIQKITAARDAEAVKARKRAEQLAKIQAKEAADRLKRENDTRINPVSDLAALGVKSVQSVRGLGAVAAIPAAQMLGGIVTSASVASQALLALPAAAGAAGVAMGTLKLATMGFGDAMDNIRDPKEFAESIKTLAPEAREAARALQGLLPWFDNLQRSTANALFRDFDTTFRDLAGHFGSMLQGGAGGVAAEFNAMFKGLAGQLMSPETTASIQVFLDNTVAAFRELSPAVAPFTNAIAGLMAAGSGALPDIAESITSVAEAFNTFIAENSADGDLQRWIDQGVAAMGDLVDVSWEFIEAFARIGEDGAEQTFDAMVSALSKTADVLPTIVEMISAGGQGFETWELLLSVIEPIAWTINQALEIINGNIAGTSISLGDLINPLSQIYNLVSMIADAWRSVFGGGDGQSMAAKAKQIQDNIAAGRAPLEGVEGVTIGGTPVGELPQSGYPRGWGGNSSNRPYGSPRIPAPPGTRGNPTGPGEGDRWWQMPKDATQPSWGGGNSWVDDLKDARRESGGGTSERERREALEAGIAPGAYGVDPYAPIGGLPSGGAMDVMRADHDVQSRARDLEDARRERLALEQDNLATQRELDDAKWKEVEAGWALQEAQAKLIEAQKGKTREISSGMEELGVALDPDFGLSKGLAGLAENLTKFIGNLLAAPFLAQMNAIVNADPIKGGYGLMGVMGAQNISRGLSPILGNPLGAGVGGYGVSGYGGGSMGYGVSPGASPYAIPGIDMSSLPGAKGANRGVQIAAQIAEDMGLTFTSGRDGRTGAGNHPQGSAGDFSNGSGNTAEQLQFANFMADNFTPYLKELIYTDPSFSGRQVKNGMPTPDSTFAKVAEEHKNHVHVAVMDEFAHLFENGAFPTPGYAPGASAAPASYGAAPTGESPWDVIAKFESSNNWQNADTGNNGHYGGLQFAPATWNAFGGQEFAPMPHLATREQQIEVANRTAFSGYNGTAPQGLGAWEVITNGSTAPYGITTASGPFPGAGAAPAAPASYGVRPTGYGGAYGGGVSPASFAGGGGVGPAFFGSGTPGMTPTSYGGLAPSAAGGGGQGGFGIAPGGTIDMAIAAGAAGLDMLAPGAGQAAQMGIKLANRAIQYGGQLAAIGVSGLMETFLPTGGSELANNGWLPRIAGAIAGAKPAVPNIAGGKEGGNQPPLTPEQAAAHGGGNAGQGGNTIEKLEYNAYGQTEDRNGADLAYHMGNSYQSGAVTI